MLVTVGSYPMARRDPNRVYTVPPIPDSFGEKLREARDKAGLTQIELSDLVYERYGERISQAVLSGWEVGRQTTADARRVAMVEDVLGLPYGELAERAKGMRFYASQVRSLAPLRPGSTVIKPEEETIIAIVEEVKELSEVNQRRVLRLIRDAKDNGMLKGRDVTPTEMERKRRAESAG